VSAAILRSDRRGLPTVATRDGRVAHASVLGSPPGTLFST